MSKVVLACALVLLVGCGAEGFDPSDAEVCDTPLCRLNGQKPVDLEDAGTDEDTDAQLEESVDPDAETPGGDAGAGSDGGQDPGGDASTSDSSVPDALAPETLVGRWAVDTATSKMCDIYGNLVDGSGVFSEAPPFEITAALDVVWLLSLSGATGPQDEAFDLLTFEDNVLRAERFDTSRGLGYPPLRIALELVFGNDDTFEGTITTEETCSNPSGYPVRSVRGTREVRP